MSWSSKKFFVFLAGAAVASSVIVGCGGEVTIPINPGTPVIPATGGVLQSRGTSNETVTAQPVPQQVQVTRDSDGAVLTAWLPSLTPLSAGEPVAIFEPGTPLIDGLTVDDDTTAKPTATRGEAGDVVIYMFGNSTPHESGVRITRDGAFSDRLICPDGHFRVFLDGPFAIVRGGNRLDIREFVFTMWVRNGIASIPRRIAGELPVNGGSSFPLRLNADYPTVFAGGFATLQVVHDNGLLRQTQRVDANGFVQFHDIVFGENSLIPRTGLNTVELDYDDTNPNNG